MLAGGCSQANVTSCLSSGGVNSFPFIYSRTNFSQTGRNWFPMSYNGRNLNHLYIGVFCWHESRCSEVHLHKWPPEVFSYRVCARLVRVLAVRCFSSRSTKMNRNRIDTLSPVIVQLEQYVCNPKCLREINVNNFSKDDNLIWSDVVLVDEVNALTCPLDITFVKRLDFRLVNLISANLPGHHCTRLRNVQYTSEGPIRFISNRCGRKSRFILRSLRGHNYVWYTVKVLLTKSETLLKWY